MIPFGEIIRNLRSECHWSQAQLAQKMGVSSSLIAHYESGERFPSLQALIDISRIFGVTTDYLLGLENRKDEFVDVSGLSTEEIDSIMNVIDRYRFLKREIP